MTDPPFGAEQVAELLEASATTILAAPPGNARRFVDPGA